MKNFFPLLFTVICFALVSCDSGNVEDEVSVEDPAMVVPDCSGQPFTGICYGLQPTSIVDDVFGPNLCQIISGAAYEAPGPMFPYDSIKVCGAKIGVTIANGLASNQYTLELYRENPAGSWNFVTSSNFTSCGSTPCPSVYLPDPFGSPALVRGSRYRVMLFLTGDGSTPIYQTTFTYEALIPFG